MALLYLGMFISIVRTRRTTPLAVPDVDVAVRFFFIVLTDACCWAPIAIMKGLALARVHISGWQYRDETYLKHEIDTYLGVRALNAPLVACPQRSFTLGSWCS